MPFDANRIKLREEDQTPVDSEDDAHIEKLTIQGFWKAAELGEYVPLTPKQIKIAGGL